MTSRATIDVTLAMLRREPIRATAGLDWEEVVAFASAQLVLPALHPAVPECAEAAGFLSGIHQANLARNGDMRARLAALGRGLNGIGIAPVLLKGAGILATCEPKATAWRFLSDLDMLVPQDRLKEAVAVAKGLGFASRDTDYNPARDAHYPALIAPDGKFALELHTRIFANRVLPLLERRLRVHAQPVRVDGAAFRLPQLADRLAHLIAHAQLHHGHLRERRLLLRGFLEFSRLTGCTVSQELWRDVLEVFPTRHQRFAAGAYLAAWRILMTPAGGLPESSHAESAWAARANRQWEQNPRARAVKAALSAARAAILRAVADGETFARHVDTLTSPKALAKRIARHRDRLKQAYWA